MRFIFLHNLFPLNSDTILFVVVYIQCSLFSFFRFFKMLSCSELRLQRLLSMITKSPQNEVIHFKWIFMLSHDNNCNNSCRTNGQAAFNCHSYQFWACDLREAIRKLHKFSVQITHCSHSKLNATIKTFHRFLTPLYLSANERCLYIVQFRTDEKKKTGEQQSPLVAI